MLCIGYAYVMHMLKWIWAFTHFNDPHHNGMYSLSQSSTAKHVLGNGFKPLVESNQ